MNSQGGKNNRRGKKEDGENKRELIFKEDGQGQSPFTILPPKSDYLLHLGADSRLVEYAQVVKMLGNGRLEAKCQDGESRLAQIRGQMRKKVRLRHLSLLFLFMLNSLT